MRRRLAALLGGLGLALGVQASTAGETSARPLPQPASGRIERLADFPSRHVAPRHVEVWLPPGYSPARRYRVVYMHDGQMLFDARITWNRQAWGVDAALSRLVQTGRVPDTLVVGIWNNGPQRYAEYYPEKFLAGAPELVRREYVEKAANGRLQSDAYLRFLVEELKPAIDARYATLPGPEGTFVMGSSMGGLISLYALCEYPQVFGGAAALSAHWVGMPTAQGLPRVRNAALPLAALNYLAARLPPAGRHRLWVDRGTDALDSLYAPALGLAAELLRDRGYTAADATVRVFEGAGHNETDWGSRLEEPLAFLLGPP
jgi:enterochelin esterase-like enzyme